MSPLHSRRRAEGDDLPPLTDAELAELEALDAALAGEDIDDAELDRLVRDVRAVAPQMRPEAAQQLNERVAEGFATPRAHGDRRRLRLRIAGGLAAGALAAGAFVVVVPTLTQEPRLFQEMSLPQELSESTRSTGDAAAGAEGPRSVPEIVAPGSADDEAAYSVAAPRTAVPPAAGASPEVQRFSNDLGATALRNQSAPRATSESGTGSVPDRTRGRSVERSVDLSVRVKPGGLPDATAAVQRIARQANGFVASSEVSLGRAGRGQASIQLRVDSAWLDRAIDNLTALGTVTAQNESARDITSTLDTARSRLADAERERRALLAALEKASTAGEIASLRAQIDQNRRLRAMLDADVKRVERRASLTTIDLTLRAPSSDDPSVDDGSWSLADAASDAWTALRTVLGALLIVAAVSAPFVLLVAAGWIVTRRRRRAARERTLDGA